MSEKLLDRHNDEIVVFEERWGRDIRITDDRQIIMDLWMCGIEIPDKEFSAVLEKYGVTKGNGELYIMHEGLNMKSNEYKQKVHNLKKCMHELSNMY